MTSGAPRIFLARRLTVSLRDWANVATILSVLCFVVSLIIAIVQINRARHVQRYAAATQLWDGYLGRSIQYPAFAYPPAFSERFSFEKRTFDNCQEEFERYEWFVSAFLRTSDEIITEFDDGHHRAKIVQLSLSYHIEYLRWRKDRKIQNDYIELFSPKLQKMIATAITPKPQV
jgi:hypothetical protein